MMGIKERVFLCTLSRQYRKADRWKTVIAVAAIILTTLMFASVVTIYQGMQEAVHEQMLYQSGSRFMVQIHDIPAEKSAQIKENPVFTEVYESVVLGSVYREEVSLPVVLKYAEKGYMDGMYVRYTEGIAPVRRNEAGVPAQYLKQCGLDLSAGDPIVLDVVRNGKTYPLQMVLSGTYEGHPNETEYSIYVSQDFLETEMAGTVSLGGNFKDTAHLEQDVAQLLTSAGFDPDASYGEAGFADASVNIAYQMLTKPSAQEQRLYLAAVLLIVCAGFFIIFNVFKISAAKDGRMYGQLKTIGTTPRQLRKFVDYLALYISVLGIPVGTLAGWGLGNAVLPMILATTSFRKSMLILPDLRMILAAVVFSFVTVFISCKIPAYAISKLPPVQALHYQETQKSSGRKIKRGKESKCRIFQMAAANLLAGSGRTFLVVLSIALSIVLFCSILNFTSTFDKDTYMQGQTGAEFNVFNPTFCAGTRLLFDDTDALPADAVDNLKNVDGIKDGGFVYFHGKPADVPESEVRNDYNGIMTVDIQTVNGRNYVNDPVKESGQALYGFDDAVFERAEVIEGELDAEKLKSGNYAVEAIISDDNGMDYADSMLTIHAGDKISAKIEGKDLSYEVLACIAVNSKLIAPAQPGEAAFMILPSSEYVRLFPQTQPVRFLCDSKTGMYASVKSCFDRLTAQGTQATYESSQSIAKELEAFLNVYQIAGNLFAGIFGVLGLLNLANVMIASAVSRQKEFAVMQSIGMTKRQLQRLFLFEGAGYVAMASLAGCLVSAVISKTAIRSLAEHLWYCSYRFQMMPAVAITVPYFAGAVLISVFVHKIWNQDSVVEKLRKAV